MPAGQEITIPNHPDRTADRYTEGARSTWERWATGFLNSYGKAHEAQRLELLNALYRIPNSSSYLPKNLFMVEALFDFGKNSPFAHHAMELFKAVMEFHAQQLGPDKFGELVKKVQGSTSFPEEARNMFGVAGVTPSQEILKRRRELTMDESLESDLLQNRKLPTDPDKMLYLLKKLKKGAIGLPPWHTFIAEVRQLFHTDEHREDWDEIKEALGKLKKKHPVWAQTQVSQETR